MAASIDQLEGVVQLLQEFTTHPGVGAVGFGVDVGKTLVGWCLARRIDLVRGTRHP